MKKQFYLGSLLIIFAFGTFFYLTSGAVADERGYDQFHNDCYNLSQEGSPHVEGWCGNPGMFICFWGGGPVDSWEGNAPYCEP